MNFKEKDTQTHKSFEICMTITDVEREYHPNSSSNCHPFDMAIHYY